MKKIDISELSWLDYNVKIRAAIKQYWETYHDYTCIGMPKPENILLYLDGVDARYTLKSGEILNAVSGDIVYTPIGSEYHVEMHNYRSRKINTVGIYFHLTDRDGVPFLLGDRVRVFHVPDKSFKLLFNKVDIYSERPKADIGRMKAGFYDIISELSVRNRYSEGEKFALISKGILCLEQEDSILSMEDIAAMCNMSEVYFRRLFKEYSGMTPLEYRTSRKIARAKQYLSFDDIPVSEIAKKLNFGTTAYFIKVFRDHTGETPLKYRETHKNTKEP